jgi:hypothetical protein
MSTITSGYRTTNADNLVQDITNSDYYIFVSTTVFSDTVNSSFSSNDFLEKTLFGKKLDSSNMFFMIENRRWQSGTVYDQYDDTTDLSNKAFYTIVYPSDNTTGDYRVFKCLFNNYGAQSVNAPNYDAFADDQLYRLGDGYVWKYMYAITTDQFKKYSALNYAPIINLEASIIDASGDGSIVTFAAENKFTPLMTVSVTGVSPSQYNISNRTIISANTSAFTVSGTETATYVSGGIAKAQNPTVVGRSIDHIEILNVDANKGYELPSGKVETVQTSEVVIYDPNSKLSEDPNYYSGQILYLTNPSNNRSDLYTIDTYEYDTSTLRATVTLLNKDEYVLQNNTFKIFPRIEITGDGTGAVAVPSINQFGVIEKITMHNKGSGYTNATARVVNPLFGFDPINTSTVDVEAILRPVLSPEGGHAANLKYELESKQVLAYLTLTDEDNLSIPSSNKYTKIGIVKNPTFITNTSPEIFDNRLELQLDSALLMTDEIVTQSLGSTVTFRGQVHEASGNTAFICNYHGPYQNYDNDGYFDIPLDPTKLIVSSQNQFISINNVIRPPYVQKTGDVYYMTSFASITRTPTSNEEYKIVLEF